MVTFALTGHRRRLRILVHAVLLSAWAVVEAGFLTAWMAAPGGSDLTVLTGAWTLLGLLVLWNGLREGAGRESLAVRPPHLVHSRNIGPFRWRRTYRLGEVLRPRVARVHLFPERHYRVAFDYRGWGRTFGGHLSAAEADCIVAMIRRAQDGDAHDIS